MCPLLQADVSWLQISWNHAVFLSSGWPWTATISAQENSARFTAERSPFLALWTSPRDRSLSSANYHFDRSLAIFGWRTKVKEQVDGTQSCLSGLSVGSVIAGPLVLGPSVELLCCSPSGSWDSNSCYRVLLLFVVIVVVDSTETRILTHLELKTKIDQNLEYFMNGTYGTSTDGI
jgi:hypothetical protein